MNIGILGTGTWGMALGRMLSNAGNSVTMWSALPKEIDALAARRQPDRAFVLQIHALRPLRSHSFLNIAQPRAFVQSRARLAFA